MRYPDVTNEWDTLQAVVAGKSIARYGDGEFKMAAHGCGIKSQRANQVLSERLRAILQHSGNCLVGIPNIWSETPKVEFWAKQTRFATLLANRPYVSSFITRPDSAPWINTPEYWDLLESLWRDQDITVVRGSGKSLAPSDLDSARQITDILCPAQHAYAEYDQILKRIGTPKRALICLGPTATLLAVDLCKRGVHAIDLGHVAMFWRRMKQGRPMVDPEPVAEEVSA